MKQVTKCVLHYPVATKKRQKLVNNSEPLDMIYQMIKTTTKPRNTKVMTPAEQVFNQLSEDYLIVDGIQMYYCLKNVHYRP